MAPAHMAPIGLAIPWPTMSGAEPCTGSNIDGCSRAGLRFADGAIAMVPVHAGPRSDRISPKQVAADDDIKVIGHAHEVSREYVDVILVELDVGIAFRHLGDATVPVGHRVHDAIRFGLPKSDASRAWSLASSNAYFRTRSTPRRVNMLCCTTTSSSVPSCCMPPTLEYSPSTFSPHHHEVDVTGLAAGERAGHAIEKAYGPEIDVLVKLAADRNQ